MLVWVVILILVIPVILILTTPFSFSILVGRDEKNHFAAEVSWLWGGITLKFENGSGILLAGPLALKNFLIKGDESVPKKKTKSKKEHKSKRTLSAQHFFNTDLISSILKALRQIWSALSIKLKGEAAFGFEDPALTGLVYGFIATAGLSGQHPGLKLTPNFLEVGFTGFLSLRGRFIVGKVLFILGKSLLSRPVRRLWWQWLRRKEVDKKWRKSTLSIT